MHTVKNKMAIADRRKREREQRRKDIIGAAEKLFFARDYDEVTMDEIADEAEVNKALLYYYFKNKEALFFAVNLRGIKKLHEIHVECANLDTNGHSKLKAMGQGYFKFFMDHPDYFRILSQAERFKITFNNDDAKATTDLLTEIWKLMVEVIMEGIEDGTIRDDLDPVELSIYFTLMGRGVLLVDPIFQKVLETRGITQDKFWKDLDRFLDPAITNRPCSDTRD